MAQIGDWTFFFFLCKWIFWIFHFLRKRTMSLLISIFFFAFCYTLQVLFGRCNFHLPFHRHGIFMHAICIPAGWCIYRHDVLRVRWIIVQLFLYPLGERTSIFFFFFTAERFGFHAMYSYIHFYVLILVFTMHMGLARIFIFFFSLLGDSDYTFFSIKY